MNKIGAGIFLGELYHLRDLVACYVLKFTGELLIEELLQQGQSQMLDLIGKVTSRLDEAYNGMYHQLSFLIDRRNYYQNAHFKMMVSFTGEQAASKRDVYDKFSSLVLGHFIKKCPKVVSRTSVPQFLMEDHLLYRVPSLETEGNYLHYTQFRGDTTLTKISTLQK